MERKGYESIGFYIYFVTLNCGLDLRFSRSNFEKLYLRNGMADRHGTKGMWIDGVLDPCCEFSTFTSPMTLALNSPHKGQWRGGLIFSFICAWTNGWVNNRNAGNFRHHRTHYDVTVMYCFSMADVRSSLHIYSQGHSYMQIEMRKWLIFRHQDYLGLLLTLIIFKPSMDTQIHYNIWDEIT